MSVTCISRSLLVTAAVSLLLGPLQAAAETTICTHVIQAAEYPIPLDERESDRQVQGRVLPGFVAKGDEQAGEGKLAEAVTAYGRVFSGFEDRGVFFGDGRCLSMSFYQEAANKLRAVANELAEQRTAKGYLLDESHDYGVGFQRGALRLYLTSNQYERFVEQAITYAENELRDRDVDHALVGLVENRLGELARMREAGSEAYNRQYANDLTPLLDEELAAFDKLGGFEAKLSAHLKPLYPRITDYWLAEEVQWHQELAALDNEMQRSLFVDRAAGTLNDGIKRLRDHPEQVKRLKRRGNERGEAYLARRDYVVARAYFDAVDNASRAAHAEERARQIQEETVRDLKRSLQADIENMQKTDDEKAAFESETEDMAAEFGFDLEE